MPYVTRSDLKTYLSDAQIDKMLDDSRSGIADDIAVMLALVVAGASQEVDGRLCQTYAVPFGDPPPSKVKAAALVFTCEAMYHRRQIPDERNPFKARADYWREQLDAIGRDGHGLDNAETRVVSPIWGVTSTSEITENSR